MILFYNNYRQPYTQVFQYCVVLFLATSLNGELKHSKRFDVFVRIHELDCLQLLLLEVLEDAC